MNLKECDGCRVGRWIYEVDGEVICTEKDCPYKPEKEEGEKK